MKDIFIEPNISRYNTGAITQMFLYHRYRMKCEHYRLILAINCILQTINKDLNKRKKTVWSHDHIGY